MLSTFSLVLAAMLACESSPSARPISALEIASASRNMVVAGQGREAAPAPKAMIEASHWGRNELAEEFESEEEEPSFGRIYPLALAGSGQDSPEQARRSRSPSPQAGTRALFLLCGRLTI
ncbi:MAG: hypothetical protein NVSMB9_02330 [Isosphaeraceae bacterium]